MKMDRKALSLGLGIAIVAFCTVGMGSYFSTQYFKVRRNVAIGTGDYDGHLTIKSDGTNDMISGDTSAGSETFTVDKDGDITGVAGTFTGTVSMTGNVSLGNAAGDTITSNGAFTAASTLTSTGKATINDQLLVDGDGVSDVQLRVDGVASQAVDIAQINLSDGTEKLTVDKDGDVFVNDDFDVTGASTLDGDVTLGDAAGDTITSTGAFTASASATFNDAVVLGNAAGDTITVTGSATCSNSFKPAQVTSDPCNDAGYGPGSQFYNATSNYMCFCDGSSDDLKMNDNSTACF
jgi:hypothetical protein